MSLSKIDRCIEEGKAQDAAGGPQLIIDRCTRNGVTAWSNVAKQLGRSVDSVRAQHDPSYMRAHIWAPERGARPEMEAPDEPEPNDADISTAALHPKGPGLKLEILRQLQNGAASAETIANRLQRTVNSIRARLAAMRHDGLVENDSRGRTTGAIEWSWTLTARGLRIAVTGDVTGCEVEAKERA